MRPICYWCAVEAHSDPRIFRSEHRLVNCERHNTPQGMFSVFEELAEERRVIHGQQKALLFAGLVGIALIVWGIVSIL